MDKKQTTATCPKCGEEIVQCENCENMGCPDCDGFVVTRGDVILCPECAAACKEDCDKMRAVGCGSCALFADEDDEGRVGANCIRNPCASLINAATEFRKSDR